MRKRADAGERALTADFLKKPKTQPGNQAGKRAAQENQSRD